MNIKLFFITILFSLAGCTTKHTGMEICFEHIQQRIGPDSILQKLKFCPADSSLHFLYLINRAIVEDSKSDSICPKTVQQYFFEHSENSANVNNLVLFLQFQAYLKYQKFDQSQARDSALHVEEKWKFSNITKRM